MLQAVNVICVYVWFTQDYTNKMAPIVNYTPCSGGSDARKCIFASACDCYISHVYNGVNKLAGHMKRC